MKMKKILNSQMLSLILLLSALPMFTACDYDHPESERGLSIELVWDDTKPDLPPDFIGAGDEDSTKIEVKKISIWLHPVDGSPAINYTFSTPQELATHKFDLPAGEYHMFATVNLLPPYIDEYDPAKSRTFTDGRVHFITLEESNLSPEQAFYCEDRIVVTEGGVQRLTVTMQELLAEVTIIINGIPREATHFIGTVENATAGIITTYDETIGEFVAERSEQIVPVELPVIRSTDGIVSIKKFRLLPSVKGATESLIKMMLLYPNTKYNNFEIHAREMRMGGKYYIVLDYADMTPIMYLKSIRIDDWTEGWTISGEIPNPEN